MFVSLMVQFFHCTRVGEYGGRKVESVGVMKDKGLKFWGEGSGEGVDDTLI